MAHTLHRHDSGLISARMDSIGNMVAALSKLRGLVDGGRPGSHERSPVPFGELREAREVIGPMIVDEVDLGTFGAEMVVLRGSLPQSINEGELGAMIIADLADEAEGDGKLA